MRKYILISLILTLLLGLFCPIILESYEYVDFKEKDTEELFSTICFGVVLLSTISLVLLQFKKEDTALWIVLKILFGTGFTMFIISVNLVSQLNFCNWSDKKELFVEKNNNSTRIVQRFYECGIFDSSEPSAQIFKAEEAYWLFIKHTPIDTNSFDRTKWIRIKN